MKYLSDQNQLVFQYESGTYGSPSGTRHWIGKVQDHSPDENVNIITVREQGSTTRNVDQFEDGNLEFTGTFTYFPQDWKFLGMAVGSVAETATAGSHVFTETNTDDANYAIPSQSLSSFTLEDSKKIGGAGSNFVRTINGAMVNSMTATFSQGEIVSCDVDYSAQSSTLSSGAVVNVAPTTTRPYMFSDTQLYISGTAVDNATEISFTINNNLEMGHYLNGSRTAKELLPMNRDYELSATVAMDSTNARTFYDNYFIGGSEFNAQIQAIGTPGSLTLTMSGCKMSDMETPSPLEGLNEQTLTITPKSVSVVVEDAIVDYNAW
jgi:hypothetical protein